MASRAEQKGQRWADPFVRQIIRARSDNDQLSADKMSSGADKDQHRADKLSELS
jgi:hypothetical protein